MNKDTAKDYLPLVQALIEGKSIQFNYGSWDDPKWREVDNFYDTNPAECYRIKPEPREIFFVEFSSGNRGPYATREIAEQSYPRCKITTYREVIE